MESNKENKDSGNVNEVEIMIDKLLNPVCEIRWRALQNILSKLNYGLINIEDLLDIRSGQICQHLLKWFSENYAIPESTVVLKLFHKILRETANGMKIMIE